MGMKLLTKEIERRLPPLKATDGVPLSIKKIVVKYFHPVGAATWLAFEYDPAKRLFFGLVTLGQGWELGYFALSDLESAVGVLGLKVERDLYLDPGVTVLEYAERRADRALLDILKGVLA